MKAPRSVSWGSPGWRRWRRSQNNYEGPRCTKRAHRHWRTPEIMLLLQRRPTQGSQMRSKAEWPRSPSFGTTPRQRHLATLRCGFLLVRFWVRWQESGVHSARTLQLQPPVGARMGSSGASSANARREAPCVLLRAPSQLAIRFQHPHPPWHPPGRHPKQAKRKAKQPTISMQ